MEDHLKSVVEPLQTLQADEAVHVLVVHLHVLVDLEELAVLEYHHQLQVHQYLTLEVVAEVAVQRLVVINQEVLEELAAVELVLETLMQQQELQTQAAVVAELFQIHMLEVLEVQE